MSPASLRAGNLIRGWMDGGCWFEHVSSLPFYVVNSVGSSTDVYVDFQLGRLVGQFTWSS